MEQERKSTLLTFKENGRYGYKDQDGEMVIPCQWLYAEDFEDGITNVMDEDCHGEIIPPHLWKNEYFQ